MLKGTLIDELIETVERAEEATHEAPLLLMEEPQATQMMYKTQPMPAALIGVA